MGHGSGDLVFPGPSLLPLLHHLGSVHQQLRLPLAEGQVFVDGGHLVLAVAAGVFFGFYVFQDRVTVFGPDGQTETSQLVLRTDSFPLKVSAPSHL